MPIENKGISMMTHRLDMLNVKCQLAIKETGMKNLISA